MKHRPLIIVSLLTLLSASVASPPAVVTEKDLDQERIYSPYVGRAYPDKVLFGDTHFHTNLSFDAFPLEPASPSPRLFPVWSFPVSPTAFPIFFTDRTGTEMMV